jgi:hypothetical protein
MGYYYEDQPPDQGDQRPGCLDALVITRAVFGLLFWPIAALVAVILDIALTFYLFALHPTLALIPVVLTAVAIAAFARCEQHRFRPHGMDDP